MLTPIVLDEIASLKETGYRVELLESEGVFNLVFDAYPLPPVYSCDTTALLLRLPVSYPNGNPDMFWTTSDLLCADGSIPRKADVLEVHMGREWRRFSWHPQNWNPSIGNLRMYLEFVNHGLLKAGEHHE